MILPLLRSLRPAQWVKAGFVLVVPLFAHRLHEPEMLLRCLLACAAFCLVASAVYLLNDLSDRERDRQHPEKCRRPIAAGQLGAPTALGAAVALCVLGTGLGFRLHPGFGWLLIAYLSVQLAYSLKLREAVLLDVFCIASGFVMRVFAGAMIAAEPVSSWLILTTIFLSLFLALCKRRAEIDVLAAGDGTAHRSTLREYSQEYLDELITITTASVILCYSLYTLDARTEAVFGTRNLVMTVPVVIFGVFRYLLLVRRGDGGGSPVATVFRDAVLGATVLVWGGIVLAVMYAPEMLPSLDQLRTLRPRTLSQQPIATAPREGPPPVGSPSAPSSRGADAGTR